jgi:hypothetical protein
MRSCSSVFRHRWLVKLLAAGDSRGLPSGFSPHKSRTRDQPDKWHPTASNGQWETPDPNQRFVDDQREHRVIVAVFFPISVATT